MASFTKNDRRVTVAATGGFEGNEVLVAIAIAHGLGIMTAVACTANISGGHTNPAVALALIVTKNIRVALGIAYIVAQFAGAALGSLPLKLLVPTLLEGEAGGYLGRQSVTFGMAKGEALLFEIILTSFLLWVIFNTAVSRKGWGMNAPIAIGFAIMLIHLVDVPFTGPSVNPARSFGPALVTNDWTNFWIYIVGPCVGALIATAGWMVFRSMGDDLLAEPAAAPAAQ